MMKKLPGRKELMNVNDQMNSLKSISSFTFAADLRKIMNKSQLLEELSDKTYVMLKPSATAGTGVIALRDIPKGCRDMFSKPDPNDKWILLSKGEVDALPAHAQFLVQNYCLYDENLNYFVPGSGFKKLDLSHFLNHSDTPNIKSINDGEYFEALNDIRSGEELFIDYGTLVPDE